MSLDVSLKIAGSEVYAGNITHNLGRMARECGLYGALWQPDEEGCVVARDLIPSLITGLTMLVAYKKLYSRFDAANGWGRWQDLVLFTADYLQACRDYPDAEVTVSR